MQAQLNFIIKIFIFSAALSALIKYGGRLLAIATTSQNAIIGIAVIPSVMLVALTWRWLRQSTPD